MVIKHLTDDEVQQYAVDKPNCETRIDAHIHLCEECRSKVEIYQLLIVGVKQQPQPAFNFNLSELVVQQLPLSKEQRGDGLLLWILLFVGVGFMGAILYYFEVSFVYLFRGITAIFIYLITITALTIITGLFIAMYKKYDREMKLLDSY
jgi:type IV secretory pathway VirB6-like protein